MSTADCSTQPGAGCASPTGAERWATIPRAASTSSALVALVPWSMARTSASRGMAQHAADGVRDPGGRQPEVLEEVARAAGGRERVPHTQDAHGHRMVL